MTKDIVIVGAGGFGKEVKELIKLQDWNFLGWVCNDHPSGERISGFPVLGSDDFLLNYHKELNVIIALGFSKPRKRLYDLFKVNSNLVFPSIISNHAIVSPDLKIGKGCIIAQGVIITTDVSIGDFCIINLGSTVAHDCTLKDFVSINPGVNISGHVTIGEGSMIGTGSSVIQDTTIGAYATVGMSSSVIRDVPDNVTVYGIPAHKVAQI